MNLVGQAAGYVASRQPTVPKAKGGGGGGSPFGMLNPMQFGKKLPTGTVPWGDAGGATGGGVLPILEEAAPLAAV